MTRKARYEAIVRWFAQNAPNAQSELDFRSPYQLICAVVLSAQCTDKRVNMVTPALFERYPDVDRLAAAAPEEVYEIIKSVSYPNSKAAHLVGMAQRLRDVYGGQVPSDIDELMSLPGVGRKTANVVASIVYDKPVIAVDTHVFRVARRLGLSDGKTPEAVERDLEAHIAPEQRPVAHHWLILHGRYICTARTPRCGECALKEFCKSYKA
ncbi:MAG: endonuclease III [Bacteroidales bacterium]|nr:endonuclease III [Bacteroidales bacterium]